MVSVSQPQQKIERMKVLILKAVKADNANSTKAMIKHGYPMETPLMPKGIDPTI